MLNVITLQPDQALLLRANEPYIYMYGNAFECIAADSTVFRAALTEDARDVDNFVCILSYDQGRHSKYLSNPNPLLPTEDSSNVHEYCGFSVESQLPDYAASPSGAARVEGEESCLPSLMYSTPYGNFSIAVTELWSGKYETQCVLDEPSLLIVTSSRGRLTVSGDDGDQDRDFVFELSKPSKVFCMGRIIASI